MADNERYLRSGVRLSLVTLGVGLVSMIVLGSHQASVVRAAVAGLLLVLLAGYLIRRHGARSSGDETDPLQRLQSGSEQRFRRLLESLPKVAVQGYDRRRRVIYWNEASTQLYGYTADEAVGCYLEDLLIPDSQREEVVAAHHAWVTKGQGIPAGELELKHKSGGRVVVFSYHIMLGEQSDNPLMFCVDVDLRELTQVRREYDLVTGFDTLSRLPERPVFEAELTAYLAECQRHGDSLAVIGIHIDPLDEAGQSDAPRYAQDDRLMAMATHRLRRGRHANPMLRFGSTNLMMVLPHLASDDDVLPLLEKIFEDISQPFALDQRETSVTASIGISLFPDNGMDAGELVHAANMAMQRARLAGPHSYWFFDRQLHDELSHQQQLMERLRDDLRDGEYVLRYLPRMAATNERIEGLEARLHFSPREGETAPPIDFIPADQRSDLMHRLGDWVMHEACRRQSQFKATATDDCRIDINLPERMITRNTTLEPLEAYMCVSQYSTHSYRMGRGRSERNNREYAIRLEAALPARDDDRTQ